MLFLIVACQLLCSLSATAQCPSLNVGYSGFSIGGSSLQKIISYATATDTFVWGVTSDGRLVGSYSVANTNYAFLYQNGTWTTFADPNQLYSTSPFGINNLGHIVGFYDGFKMESIPRLAFSRSAMSTPRSIIRPANPRAPSESTITMRL